MLADQHARRGSSRILILAGRVIEISFVCMGRLFLLVALLMVAVSPAGTAQTVRSELWRGVWISLPNDVKVEGQQPPVPEVIKQTRISFAGGSEASFYIELWRLKKGEPSVNIAALASAERRWLRGYAKNVTVRVKGNSYSYSYIKDGGWIYRRNIRYSPRQLIKAYLNIPSGDRYSEETRRMIRMVESISLRR